MMFDKSIGAVWWYFKVRMIRIESRQYRESVVVAREKW